MLVKASITNTEVKLHGQWSEPGWVTVAMRCDHPCSIATQSKVLRIAISRACTRAVNTVWRRHHKRWLHCTFHPCKCIGSGLRIAIAKVRPELVGCVEPIIRLGQNFCFYRCFRFTIYLLFRFTIY